MLKKILIVLVVLIALFIVVGFILPTEFEVNRSLVINAEPAKIHEYVGDLKRWPDWTPFQDNDETVKVTLGEKTSGVGASQTWNNEKNEDGVLTFTEWDPNKGVEYEMSMNQGQWPSKGWVRYKKVEGGTEVTWGLKGDMDMAFGGYFVLMMDGLVGDLYLEGLEKLKGKVENPEHSREPEPASGN